MSLPVEVKIDVILHATEDSKKIFEALFDNFGLIKEDFIVQNLTCLLYTSPSPRDATLSSMQSTA